MVRPKLEEETEVRMYIYMYVGGYCNVHMGSSKIRIERSPRGKILIRGAAAYDVGIKNRRGYAWYMVSSFAYAIFIDIDVRHLRCTK